MGGEWNDWRSQPQTLTCSHIAMSYHQLSLTAACALTLISCGPETSVPTKAAVAPSPPAAVDPKQGFASQLNNLSDTWESLGKISPAEPEKMITALNGLTAGLENMSTKGLPEELIAPFARLIDAGKLIGPLLASIPPQVPKDPGAAQAYLQENPEAMKTMMDLQEKMILLQRDRNAALAEFGSIAKKLGLDVGKFLGAATFTGAQKPAP